MDNLEVCRSWQRVCVCVCVGGVAIFTRSPGLARMAWRPRVGSLPSKQAHCTGSGCVPVVPLDQCDMHFGPEPGSLPQDHPGSEGGSSVASAGPAPR